MKRKRGAAGEAQNSGRFALLHAAGWVLLMEFIGVAGSFVTVSAIPSWYVTLVKPVFAPPNWIFGPVWTLLYALMGVVAYRVSRIGMHKPAVRGAMMLFGSQLVLNGIWSYIFFGLRNIPVAFVDIAAMWVLILLTVNAFRKLDRTSAYLMIPYFWWVSFASVLNYHIWLLNP